jgi:hypothetical protein
VLTILVLHLISSHNPALDTLSSYAFTDRGAGMLAMSILSLSIGSLTVLGALRVAGVPLGGTTTALFCTWSGGLALAATFPASYEKFPNPVSGAIHQYSCLAAFLSAPGIAWSLLRRREAQPVLAGFRAALRRWSRWSVGSLVVFGISYVINGFPHAPVSRELYVLLPVGVTQRITLSVDLALLAILLVLAARTAATRTEPVRVGAAS